MVSTNQAVDPFKNIGGLLEIVDSRGQICKKKTHGHNNFSMFWENGSLYLVFQCS